MQDSISRHYQALADAHSTSGHSLSALSQTLLDFTQNPSFFSLCAQKQLRFETLKTFFNTRQHIQQFFIGQDINRFSAELEGWDIHTLPPGFFNEQDSLQREKNKKALEGSVVILNNNDLARSRPTGGYADFYATCDKTIFCIWDWDNHHWLENSCFAAAHSDLYFPAHHENIFLLTRYNWLTAPSVHCASIQWSRSFLANSIRQIVDTERSNIPLGKHVPYAMFPFRNSVIQTLSNSYPSVGFSSQAFHDRSPEDRFAEWCSHKVHWIMPVLNDIPIRIFDALITGGIPIVPSSLKLLPGVQDIPEEFMLFFNPLDVIQPADLVQRALTRFDSQGVDGIVKRHRYALEHHHGTQRILSILALTAKEFGLHPPQGSIRPEHR